MTRMFSGFRISLANKCQLLFGAAVVVILGAALFVVAQRMHTLVERGPRQQAQLLAEAWLADKLELDEPLTGGGAVEPGLPVNQRLSLELLEASRFGAIAAEDDFLKRAIQQFRGHPKRSEAFREARDNRGKPIYRYVRAIRASDLRAMRSAETKPNEPAISESAASVNENTAKAADTKPKDINHNNGDDAKQASAGGGAGPTAPSDPLRMLLLVQLRDPAAASQGILNHLYLVAAGLFAGLLAIGVFWFITTRLILSPVRLLRDYAEQVYEGDLNIRSDINTGDEFEELSDMFNAMLANLKQKTDKLESINKSLDLKLGELAESNVALYEANKMKGEFLANVSHELRTPLNSIIGFAEVLQDTIEDDGTATSEKRRRYTQNIITSSRRLLELITELLDLAKIEAGRMEVRPSEVSIADTVEGLINLIQPQADAKGIQVTQQIPRDLPLLRTDPGKLQQILFNLLANAVKFTPKEGTVTLAARREPAGDERNETTHVRLSVTDTGPGIAEADRERIFEQFTQVQTGLEREQGGTGLGLTISQELAHLLQGRLELESTPGEGSTFSLVLPLDLEAQSTPLMPEEGKATTASKGSPGGGNKAPHAGGAGHDNRL